MNAVSEVAIRSGRRPGRGTALAAFVLLLALGSSSSSPPRGAPNATVASDSARTVVTLTTTPVVRQLSPSAVHRYRAPVHAGDYVAIAVESQRIDVGATLSAPDGAKIADVHYRQPGGFLLTQIAGASGDYELQIVSLEPAPQSGRYSVAIETSRRAEPADRERVLANGLLLEADALRADWRLDSSLRALERYGEALKHWKAARDDGHAAIAARKLGETYALVGKPDQALPALIESVELARRSASAALQCRSLTGAARVQLDLGNTPDATANVKVAVQQCQRAGDRSGEADALNVLGDTFQYQGQSRRSLDLYARALQVSREVGDRRVQAQALLNSGYAHTDLSEVVEAQQSYESALALWRTVDDRRGEAATLTALGHLLVALGENQAALGHYRGARETFERLGDLLGLGSVLNGIGAVHFRSGDTTAAIPYLTQAAETFHTIKQQIGEATSLEFLGVCATAEGRSNDALGYYSRALALARATSSTLLEAKLLELVGHVELARGQLDSALTRFQQSKSLSESIGFRIGEIYALSGIGDVRERRGQHAEALNAFAEALLRSQRARNPFGESSILYNLAKTEAALGNSDRALARITESLDRVEDLRSDVASLDLRASYLASVRDRHELQVDLLMRMQAANASDAHTALAFEASELARARSFLDGLAQARANIREGVAATLLDREASIRRTLNAAAQRLMRIQSGGADVNEIAASTAEIEKQTSAYKEIEARIRAESPRYASLTQPRPLTLPQVQQLIDDDRTVLLQYFLGSDRSYVWAVTRRAIKGFSLPPRRDIEALVLAYRAALSTPPRAANSASQIADRLNKKPTPSGARTPDPGMRAVGSLAARDVSVDLERSAREVSDMLLGPVAPYLTNARVLVVADGVLNLLPFGALPDPRRVGGRSKAPPLPLVAGHEVVNLPSASTLALLRGDWNQPRRWQKPAIVFADPVYERDDPRIPAIAPNATAENASDTRAIGGARIARLKQTGREAQSIAALASSTDVALAFDANRTAALNAAFQNYRIVHFAAHGLVDDHRPELSGIVLSLFDRNGQPQDGFLRLHDIYNLKIPADLVVLSACSTALGKDIIGEGLIGLVRGFMYAGSRRVVASLWEVDDEATSELMTRLYRGMFVKKLTPPAALRAAQVELMRETKWKAPFYWAAFVLQGDWN